MGNMVAKERIMDKHANRHNGHPGRNGRAVLPAIVLFLACLSATACTGIPDRERAGGTAAEGAVVRLTVSLPQPAFPQHDTRADGEADDTENLIERVMVLVFEQQNGHYVYRYRTEGERIESSGSTTQFKARLVGTENPVKLLLAGNYGDAFTAYAPSPGDSESDVRAGMGSSFAGISGALPMYGEIEIPDGLRTDTENTFGIKMLRAIARVDVVKELTADSHPFRLASVHLYRPNDKIQIAPDEAVSPDAPRVTAPSVFAGAQLSPTPTTVAASGTDPASVTGIYVPEAASVTDPAGRLTGVTCIVVGGYYDGQEQPSYYRIDFDPGLDGHPFGQILRNYKYVFRITKVNGTGWSDPDTAATNRATSIVAEIEAWADFTTEMYFEGENYIGLSSRKVTLGYRAGKSGTVDVQTSVPYTIQWLDASGNPTGEAVSGVGATLPANGGMTVAIVRNTGDADTVTHLTFTATGDNRTTNDVIARLRITADRWTMDIAAIQESPEKYRKRIIRVLSVSDVGSLGTNTPSTASGLPLRRILENTKNFSSDGTVIIGGFSFSEASRSEIQATGTGSASDKELFRSMQSTINAQDVIYLTYNTPISNELAQVVLSWLRANTFRVLIVGTDTETTNAQLRQYLTGDGTWKYYNQSPYLGGSFKRAAQTAANARFFTVPFGQVAENAPINRADDLAGYCSDYPSSVTPLVVSNVTGQDKTMVVGVNLQSRIVYLGDANLNQNGRLSAQANADGTITSDFDRLTANLWAWITDQVCGI